MKQKNSKIKIKWIILMAILLIGAGVGIFWAVISYKLSLIPSMTFDEMIAYTTEDNEDAIITIGIIQDGEMTYTVYGNNASILPHVEHTYEIGSLTKTFTASLLCKAMSQGKIDLSNQIDEYVELPKREYYPTLERLVTHTSGYKGYYFEWQMASNFLHKQENDFYGVTNDELKDKLGEIILKDQEYDFTYSNFGFATVGRVLSDVYDKDYTTLMNQFITEDLRLNNTKIADGSGDLSGYWDWKQDDAYIPAGGITSNISDMMEYINLQMSDDIPYLSKGQQVIGAIDATTSRYAKLNIRMDSIGIGWLIDEKNNIIWHNGGTSNFNSYAAFDKEKQIGVVILSNCSPNYRIPTTVMGVKIMTTLQDESVEKDSIHPLDSVGDILESNTEDTSDVLENTSDIQILSITSEDGNTIVNVETTLDYNDEKSISNITVVQNGVIVDSIDNPAGYYEDMYLDKKSSLVVIEYFGRQWSNFLMIDMVSGKIFFYEPFCFNDVMTFFGENNNKMEYEVNINHLMGFSCEKIVDGDVILVSYYVHDTEYKLQSGTFQYTLSKKEFNDLQQNDPITEG